MPATPPAPPPPPSPPSAAEITPSPLPPIAESPESPPPRATAQPPEHPPPIIINIQKVQATAEQTPDPAPESDEEASAEPAKQEMPDAPASPFAVREPTRSIVNRRGEAIPLRRMSADERDRYRRRLNFVFAVAGLAVLAIVLAVLLHVRP